ncbi:peptidyl-prolyl cis-trans isomerase G-like [Procambarus clarkii]|uniref:peptidyl-prolyl cis-trans isomerase G-like n=1 Tax=Procambarus clarkii TaxID=6728 RepID=UPI00374449D5
MKLLELEDTSVVDMTTQGEEGKIQLQAMLGSLDTVNTAQEVFMTINEVDQCNMEVENWLKKCQELFPNVKTVHTSVKAGGGWPGVGRQEAVEAGRVLAVQEDQDGRRSARITLQDGQLYLHPLLRQPTPAHAHTLQESEVVGVLEPSCTLAFLDLGWAGSTRGRVTIRLTPDTPLARQFVLLCTGQRGHTYRNTKLLQVWNKGQPGEWVAGGDYESNDGKGGASLLPDLQGQYRESGRAGAVVSRAGTVWSLWGPGSPSSAQFAITTRDRQGGHHWSCVFGDVVSGLDVVRAAVNHSNIREVTVVDCGVVLPLSLYHHHHYCGVVLPL